MATETLTPAPKIDEFRRVSFTLKDGEMAGLAWGETDQPLIVFLHATGFNARAYRALLAPLGERFHVVALDLRGHGRSTLPERRFGYDSWKRYASDVIAALERHFTQPATLAGHSMGGTVSLVAAGRRPDLISGVALIDPVILEPHQYALMELPGAAILNRFFFPIAAKAAKRRALFPDHATAQAALTGRGIFKSFSPEMLADYIADGFVEAPGGVRLACAPAYEALTFAAQRNHPWQALRKFGGAVTVLRAEHHSTLSLAAMKRIAALRPDARLATVEGATHGLPMERPDRARAAIEAAALMGAPSRVYAE